MNHQCNDFKKWYPLGMTEFMRAAFTNETTVLIKETTVSWLGRKTQRTL